MFDYAFHGAWAIPAGAIALMIVRRAFKSFGQLKAETLRFIETQQVVFLGIGFFTLVIFAQFTGRQVVWRAILGEHYVRIAGRFAEEIFELLGYVILVIGSIECYVSAGADQPKALRDERQ